jgi:thiamine biosynthesis lipoprotein
MKGLALLLLLAGSAVERRLAMMGTSLEIRVEAADRGQALAASERAVAALEAAERRLSTWRDDSELARLNASPAGQAVPLSPELAADLEKARRCWEETNGTFNPAVGKLVRAWGLRTGGRRPSPEELREAVAAADPAALRELEEGGWGKGAGLADALKALAGPAGLKRALLDLGGQVAVTGDGPWSIPVADPQHRERPVVALTIDGGSVSTSGNSERGIVVDGERLGHILDPRSGRPAPDFGSLTVWTADPLRADCLSTGLYVMGPEPALGWAADHPGVEVLVLRPREDRIEALASAGLEGKLEVLVDGVDLAFWNNKTESDSEEILHAFPDAGVAGAFPAPPGGFWPG